VSKPRMRKIGPNEAHALTGRPTPRVKSDTRGIREPKIPLASTRNHVLDRIESKHGTSTERIPLTCAACAERIAAHESALAVRTDANTGLCHVHVKCYQNRFILAPIQDQHYMTRGPVPNGIAQRNAQQYPKKKPNRTDTV
jgi:hypothetical protein